MLGVLLRDVVQKVIETEGEPPDRVALTHPANWGSFRCVLSEEVARQARLKNLFLVTEPEAAAAYYTASRQVADGETVAVYDLGGGTFDTTVLRQSLGRTSRTWCVPRSSPLSWTCIHTMSSRLVPPHWSPMLPILNTIRSDTMGGSTTDDSTKGDTPVVAPRPHSNGRGEHGSRRPSSATRCAAAHTGAALAEPEGGGSLPRINRPRAGPDRHRRGGGPGWVIVLAIFTGMNDTRAFPSSGSTLLSEPAPAVVATVGPVLATPALGTPSRQGKLLAAQSRHRTRCPCAGSSKQSVPPP